MTGPTSLRVLVVDDERYARKRIIELLEARDEVETIEGADSGEAAIEALRTSAYDLVFLDVQMPNRTGIEVVETIGPSVMPTTIFVTAYDEYALKAFECAALDYLLKPFDDDRFEQAFQRALEMMKLYEAEAVTDRFRRLLQASDTSTTHALSSPDQPSENGASASGQKEGPADEHQPYLERLTIDLPGKVRVVPVDEIRYITAEDVYVKVHTEDDTYLLRERMHVLEDRLSPSDFARVHRSTIVRLDLIETVSHRSGGNYALRLNSGEVFKVSRSRRDALIDQLETGVS